MARANAAVARVEEKYRAKRLQLQVEYREAILRFRRNLTGEGERGRAVEVRVNGSLGEVALLAAPEVAAAELAAAVRALLPHPLHEGGAGGVELFLPGGRERLGEGATVGSLWRRGTEACVRLLYAPVGGQWGPN